MRRPSGDRHRKSVTNAMRLPSHANTHGHDPFSRCSATIASSTPPRNSACATPFGQTMRATSIDGARAETEVERRSGEHLLLHEQARADLDLAADAERS